MFEVLTISLKLFETVKLIVNISNKLFESFPLVLWRCWLGGRKGIQPVRKMGYGLLVMKMPGALHVLQLQLSLPPPSTVAPIKSRTDTFWYWLTQVHLQKWPLKWRESSTVIWDVCPWLYGSNIKTILKYCLVPAPVGVIDSIRKGFQPKLPRLLENRAIEGIHWCSQHHFPMLMQAVLEEFMRCALTCWLYKSWMCVSLRHYAWLHITGQWLCWVIITVCLCAGKCLTITSYHRRQGGMVK